MNEILTKQEYEEKENKLTKSVIDFAMNTEEFKERGCYVKEFVKVGDKEVTLMVMDDSWVATRKDAYYDFVGSRDCYKSNKFLMGLY